MAARRLILAVSALVLAAGLSARPVQAQPGIPDPFDPGLPYQNPSAGLPPSQELLGLNSFGAGAIVPGLHNDIPRPPLEGIDIDDLIPPPPLPPVPRYYIYCYYYGCRPWLIHPYTGATLQPWQILNSIASTNPDFQQGAAGKTLQQLIEEVDPRTGEAMVQVEDMGLVDESNQKVIESCDAEDLAEHLNAQAVGVSLGARRDLIANPNLIVHAPFYGLYCLRVRICIPIFTPSNHITTAGQILPWRFYCRFRYLRHQPVCWSYTWWYRWCRTPQGNVVLCPWRPWCLPHTFWTRSGPDWVAHIQSVNTYRHWCLWGFRYYIPRLASTGPTFNPTNVLHVPRIAQLSAALNPQFDTWLRYWPYPRVRYWPFRPYCTRWYWFRCFPWYFYRHYAPVTHFAVAVPKAEYGAGFIDNMELEGDENAPLDPPNLVDGVPQPRGDSFFDIFTDLDIECRGRAETHPLGDGNGDGFVNSADNPIGVRQTAAILINPDTDGKDDDDQPTDQ